MANARIDEAQLENRLGVLEMARSWSPRVISRLESTIRNADDEDLFRFNPVAYALHTSMAEDEAIALFVHATRAGLLDMEWNLVCASCGHLVESLSGMAKLHSHYTCDMCFAENKTALDDFIHVTFTVPRDVRKLVFHDPTSLAVEDFYFKYRMSKGIRPLPEGMLFNDVLIGWTKLLTYLQPGEKRTIELEGQAGWMYRISDALNNTACVMWINPPSAQVPERVRVALSDGKLKVLDKPLGPPNLDTPAFKYTYDQGCILPSGSLLVEFENLTDRKGSVWVVGAPQELVPPRLEFEHYLSGKRLLNDQTFRELFGGEAIDPAESIAVKDITVLFADLKDSTTLYEEVGDPRAYHVVRQYFAALTRSIARHSGAVCKTVGDTVMATFGDPVDAVAAAIDMQRELEELGGGLPQSPRIKMGMHRGHALLVTLNDRCDYFGQTINIADRMRRLAQADELCLSREVTHSPGVADLLDRFGPPSERDDPRSSDDKALAFLLRD
jgi:class 3 adenylate cyclase